MADGAFGDALSQILTITRMDTTTEPGQVVVTFTLAVPADGLVARLGPLTCRVANRAFPGHWATPCRHRSPSFHWWSVPVPTAYSTGFATRTRMPSCALLGRH